MVFPSVKFLPNIAFVIKRLLWYPTEERGPALACLKDTSRSKVLMSRSWLSHLSMCYILVLLYEALTSCDRARIIEHSTP